MRCCDAGGRRQCIDEALRIADIVTLHCPLSSETRGMINGQRLGLMKRSAILINVARAEIADEAALYRALADGTIAGAALDVTAQEPLASTSPLWTLGNVLITPHTAGETRKYEDNVLDILLENLDRLWRGEARLKNEIV